MLTEIEFYNRLAEFFDVMTDWQSRLAFEMPFLEEILKQRAAQSVLDCACGTGWHAIALAQRGYDAAGADASTGMIERARANAARLRVAVPFAVAPFQSLRKAFEMSFDALLCLGNSFPHVVAEPAALASLKEMRACLRPGGVLLLHNLNYDKRWKEKPRWFAVNSGVLNGRETLVWRFADYGAELVTFNIALFSKSDANAWSVEVQSTLQRPYSKQALGDLCHAAGFSRMEFYGDLQGRPFDPDRSGDLVLVATA